MSRAAGPVFGALAAFTDPASGRPNAARHIKAFVMYPGRFAIAVPALLVGGYEVLARLMAGTSPQLMRYTVDPAWRWWAVAMMVGGLAVFAWTNVLFHRAEGTLSPHDGPKHLVTTGPFAVMRDPMLLSVIVFMFGCAGGLGSWIHAAYTALFAVVIGTYLKRVEQPKLRLKQGYADYERQVPFMWIPYRRNARQIPHTS